MRTSIGALAAAATIALAFLYMLPQNRPGVSGPTDAVAQGTDATEQAIVASTQASAGTLASLSDRITVDYGQTPLGGVFDHLRDHPRVVHHEGMGYRQHDMIFHPLDTGRINADLAIVGPR